MATITSNAPATASETIPATMQAAVYRAVNDVRVETVPVPEIGPGEVLIRVHSCGICGTDLKKIHTGSHSAPRIFGHETSGTIVKTGEGVEDFAIGDRVMVFHHIPCGKCYYCRKKTFAQCATYKKVGCMAALNLRVEASPNMSASWTDRFDGWSCQDLTASPLNKLPVEPVTRLKAIKNLNLAPDETVLSSARAPSDHAGRTRRPHRS